MHFKEHIYNSSGFFPSAVQGFPSLQLKTSFSWHFHSMLIRALFN